VRTGGLLDVTPRCVLLLHLTGGAGSPTCHSIFAQNSGGSNPNLLNLNN